MHAYIITFTCIFIDTNAHAKFYIHVYTHAFIYMYMYIKYVFLFTSCIPNVFAVVVGVYNVYLLRSPRKSISLLAAYFRKLCQTILPHLSKDIHVLRIMEAWKFTLKENTKLKLKFEFIETYTSPFSFYIKQTGFIHKSLVSFVMFLTWKAI